jgi:hypothetical protein
MNPQRIHRLQQWAVATAFVGCTIGMGLMVVPGCTTSQQAVQYRTLKAVALSVDSTLKGYADAVVAGKVGADTQAKVLDLKSRYADAMTAAIAAAQASTDPAPQAVQQAADALLTLVQAALRGPAERGPP